MKIPSSEDVENMLCTQIVFCFCFEIQLPITNFCYGQQPQSLTKCNKQILLIFSSTPQVYVADCLFWIPIQAINFWKVPPTWRVLYIGLMTFVWTNVLCFARSYKTNKEQMLYRFLNLEFTEKNQKISKITILRIIKSYYIFTSRNVRIDALLSSFRHKANSIASNRLDNVAVSLLNSSTMF